MINTNIQWINSVLKILKAKEKYKNTEGLEYNL